MREQKEEKKEHRGRSGDSGKKGKPEATVSRRCVVSRRVCDRESLLRFVLSPSGKVVPDLRERLPGRGCWVEARRSCVSEAVKKRVFFRCFGKEAEVEEALPDRVEEQLLQDALSALGLARKAGVLVFGDHNVREAARRGELFCLLVARGVSEKAEERLCRTLELVGKGVLLSALFSAQELGQALGFEESVYVGLRANPSGKAFSERVLRFSRFREEK